MMVWLCVRTMCSIAILQSLKMIWNMCPLTLSKTFVMLQILLYDKNKSFHILHFLFIRILPLDFTVKFTFNGLLKRWRVMGMWWGVKDIRGRFRYDPNFLDAKLLGWLFGIHFLSYDSTSIKTKVIWYTFLNVHLSFLFF